ncbi:MAG: chemotaxis protein CheA [Bacteroidota bacterium]
MDSLQQIFIQEATELLGELEEALLIFEKDLTDRASIERIFRVMHTLKGSSAMFGFTRVNDFTHELEYIYDALREGTLTTTPEILELTLQSVDHLKILIDDPESQDEKLADAQAMLLEKIKKFTTGNVVSEMVKDELPVHESLSTYYISFKPFKDLLKNGSNPMYLLEDLLELGKGLAFPAINDLPELEKLALTDCHTSFEVILETSCPLPEIEDVFLFVEGAADISIELIVDRPALNNQVEATFQAEDPLNRPFGIDRVSQVINEARLEQNESQSISKAQKNTSTVENKNAINSIRVSSEKLDALMNQISELVTTQARLSMLVNGLEIAELGAVTEGMGKITRNLRDNAFSICLIPIDTLVIRFQRLVRDLSKELGKNIELVTEGTDTELDKSIIEKLSDPLLHLMRNCIDHGIEHSDVRKELGKNERGTIKIEAYNSGTNVFIKLSDDGAGIDLEKVRQRAIDKQIISEDVELTEQETYQLLFKAGFSTAVELSDISGRGVGMDVVKRGIEDLQGDVVIESEKGKGTSFIIRLPLTLSIIDGLLVEIGENTYVIPLHLVDKCYEIPAALLMNVNQQLVLDGKRMPVFHLREALHCETPSPKLNQVIKIKFLNEEVGISVDTIIGEHQVVLKPMGTMYKNQEEFSGATILGDGTVALVFDINKLLKKLISESSNNVTYGKLSYQ